MELDAWGIIYVDPGLESVTSIQELMHVNEARRGQEADNAGKRQRSTMMKPSKGPGFTKE